MFPMSLRTSAGSVRAFLCCVIGADTEAGLVFVIAVVGDGEAGNPGRLFIVGYSAGRIPARVFIVPAFSFAKGRESDSVLELDCKIISKYYYYEHF